MVTDEMVEGVETMLRDVAQVDDEGCFLVGEFAADLCSYVLHKAALSQGVDRVESIKAFKDWHMNSGHLHQQPWATLMLGFIGGYEYRALLQGEGNGQ